ncbi:MAG: ribosome maturation factor RimM [Candidatus Gastranaerophilales bacterium]|nr:ribosome maturation factor RimM [Candidatus Gastranaerophilales bacterium]
MSDNYISIGKITNFHGIAGEVKVGYTKGKEHQLLGEDIFYIKKDNAFQKLTLSKIRFHKNTALIKFEEINSINEALEFKGCILYLEKESLKNTLEEDEFLVDDLIGANAYNQNSELIGIVDCINKQGFSDLLSIKNNEGKSFLVPFVKELVPTVDLENKKIVINAIEGLIE